VSLHTDASNPVAVDIDIDIDIIAQLPSLTAEEAEDIAYFLKEMNLGIAGIGQLVSGRFLLLQRFILKLYTHASDCFTALRFCCFVVCETNDRRTA